MISLPLLLLISITSNAKMLKEEWKKGLSGAKLTSYKGSNISSNSTLTTIKFCRNGRYSYYKEVSWYVLGQTSGASHKTITGRWGIRQNGQRIFLTYITDKGRKGFFPLYLQKNSRVNVGGTIFTVQKGMAGC